MLPSNEYNIQEKMKTITQSIVEAIVEIPNSPSSLLPLWVPYFL